MLVAVVEQSTAQGRFLMPGLVAVERAVKTLH